MKYFKYTQYIYLLFAAYLIFDGVKKLNNPALGEAWLNFIIAAFAIFMFFFRRRFTKKFEERNKNMKP
ncbi:hypothetical protein K5V07_02200 [Flavobacterium sp. CHNK8]|uniref:hypothetical protein n=1 Tax=Flavobacterium sp. CHNK8 TaxID=2871165 RepID=UPI001C8D1116|nr:hypothetical protein [Flavobacterium sp. CHNK8]QZK89366.1 hypothetical protein K5V07_02200 [Flavobacterium sp. CHNK8]